MSKRYQVFVSSTFADLKEERRKVSQALMEMDCIPAGMELFPAADEEQWEFIKRIIDDCDYYVLIIGGRYGSTTTEGVSYTEKEYDYAIQKGIKVLSFLHENPDEIPVGKSDIQPQLRKKLAAFREKVSKNRLVKFWKSTDQLPSLVALSLLNTIKVHPATGWIRGDKVPTDEILNEINQLRKINSQLNGEVSKLKSTPPVGAEELAQGDDPIRIAVKVTIENLDAAWNDPGRTRKQYFDRPVTWNELLGAFGPALLNPVKESEMRGPICKMLRDKVDTEIVAKKSTHTAVRASISDTVFDTIKIQFVALGLIDSQIERRELQDKLVERELLCLTERGKTALIQVKAVRKEQPLTNRFNRQRQIPRSSNSHNG